MAINRLRCIIYVVFKFLFLVITNGQVINLENQNLEAALLLFEQKEYDEFQEILSQTPKSKHTTLYYFMLGHSQRKQYFFDEAQINIELAYRREKQKEKPDKKLLGHISYDMAYLSYVSGDYNACKNFLKEAKKNLLLVLSPTDVKIAEILEFKGMLAAKNEDYNQALSNYEEALSIRKSTEKHIKDLKSLANLYNNQANSNYRLGRYTIARNKYQEALNIWTKIYDSSSKGGIIMAYIGLGNMNSELGDYVHAIDYYNLALSACSQSTDIVCPFYIAILINLAETQAKLEFYEPAYQNLDLALELQTQLETIDHENLGTIYLNLGYVQYSRGYKDEALKYLQNALATRISIRKKDSDQDYGLRISAAYMSLGEFYQSEKDFNTAENFYLKALESRYQSTLFHPEVASNFQALSQISLENGEWVSALNFAQRGLISVAFQFSNEDFSINPEGKALNSPYRVEMIQLLKLKGDIWRKYENNSPESHSLQKAFDTYKIAESLVDSIRNNLGSMSSRRYWLSSVFSLYESAIETSFLLYQQKEDKYFKREAFRLSEKYKAMLLLISLKEIEAKKASGLKLSLLNKEQELREELRFYEEKKFLSEIEGKQLTSKEKASFAESRLKYHAFIQDLELSYPEYYKLKYQTQISSIDKIQEELIKGREKVVIEYFFGDSALYIFSIDQKNISVRKVEHVESVYQDIRLFKNLCKKRSLSDSTDQMDFYQLGRNLYDILLGPEIVEKNNLKSVLIIPDGVLNGLSFEVLLSPNTKSTIKGWDYLLINTAIHYGHSATIFLTDQEKEYREVYNKKRLGIFAPSFDKINETLVSQEPSKDRGQEPKGTSLSFLPLVYSSYEAKQLEAILGGEAFIGSGATKRHFMDFASKYQVLHICTHAMADTSEAMASSIIFADSLLSVAELYKMELSADLVVLSACETGVGRYVRGEGAMTLARGFAYAGCPNTLMSLWSVDDKSTASLMEYFYVLLEEGMDRDEALRKAKLRFIKSTNNQNIYPYFWAGFQYWGTERALANSSTRRCFILVFLLMTIVAAIIWIFYNRNYKK